MKAVPFEELSKYDGKSDNKIYVSILGLIYDCTEGGEEFFGETGPYKVFAGKDASFSLAMMSLSPSDTNKFEYELDRDDLQALSEWLAYFDARYQRIGFLVGKAHPLKVNELPPCPRKTMGGTTYGGNPDQLREQAEIAAEQEKMVGAAKHAQKEDMKLSQLLFQRTKVQHTRALRGEFMGKCMNGSIERSTYALFVASLYYVYRELEQKLEQHKDDPLISSIHSAKLLRLPNLVEDLECFYGESWGSVLPAPTLWAIRYVGRVHDVAKHPHRLVVHHWMRYGGGLAGGQFLRTSLANGLKLEEADDGTTPGIRYHQFEMIGNSTAIQQYYEDYLSQLDSLEAHLSKEQLADMVDEAKTAFDININLNDDMLTAESKL